jgi:threonine/homoserine/homoserine lactone efflux protein
MSAELLPLMTYCFVMSSTPGPNNVMLTASGANFGYRGALPQILGINVGVALQTFVCCLGLGSLFASAPLLQDGLRIAGALYLIVLAWKLSGAGGINSGEAPRPVSFWQGLMFQAVNPKSWVKAVTIASVFMPAGLSPVQGGLVAALLGSVIGFPCSSSWALFGVAIRRWLDDPAKRRIFNLSMGGTLLVLAIRFLA